MWDVDIYGWEETENLPEPEYEYSPNYDSKPVSLKVCKFCGEEGLHWEIKEGSWKLFKGDVSHVCNPNGKEALLRDKEKGIQLLTALIRWANSNEPVTLTPDECGYMRNEIERLRKIESKMLRLQKVLKEV